MKIGLMRAVDRFLGVPLCWLAGMGARPLVRPPLSDGEPILVIKFFGLGSIVLAMPFLAALRYAFPHSPLYMLTFSQNKELILRLPYALHPLFIDTSSPVRFALTAIRILRRIRAAKVKAVFDLEFFSKFSTLLSRLSGATIRVGFQLPTLWRRRNVTHAVPLDTGRHVSQVFLSQLEQAEIAVRHSNHLPSLQSTPAEIASLVEKLGSIATKHKVVVVNINAGPASLERRWPPERFVETVIELHRRDARRRFVFVGNAEEHEYIATALASSPIMPFVAVNLAGRISLGEYLALCEISECVLSNDSGPLHLAAAAGARVIGLYGPESPTLYGPLGLATVIYGNTACSPCLTVYNAKYFVCPYNAACMQQISVAGVVLAIESIRARYVRAS